MYIYKKILLPVIIFLFLLTIGSCGSGFYENEYSYDNQDRLKEEKYENPLESKKIEYIYDNNGNIVEVRIN